MCPSVIVIVGWVVGVRHWRRGVWVIFFTITVVGLSVMMSRILRDVLLSGRLRVRLLLVALLKRRLGWIRTTMGVMLGCEILASVGFLRVRVV